MPVPLDSDSDVVVVLEACRPADGFGIGAGFDPYPFDIEGPRVRLGGLPPVGEVELCRFWLEVGTIVGVTELNIVGDVDGGRASGCVKGASTYEAVVTGGVNPPMTEGVNRTDLFAPPSSEPSWSS